MATGSVLLVTGLVAVASGEDVPSGTMRRPADRILDLLYSFGRTPGGPRVYALAGVGTYRITLSSKAGGIAAADQSENKFGWNAGAGATIPLGRVSGFLEARYFNLSNTFIQGAKAPFVAIVAGVRFGGN